MVTVVTEKEISDVIQTLAKSFDDELFSKQESELEKYWHFTWDETTSIELNTYQFNDLLSIYGNFCLRWEEKHNGSCCVVERVRDKYLLPKIRQFVAQISAAIKSESVDLAERAKREAEEKTSRAREADINHRKAINQSILVALRRCGGKGD